MPLPRWSRRVLSPLFLVVVVALFLLCALIAGAGALVAPIAAKRRLLRVGAFGMAYFGIEAVALVAAFFAWLVRRAHPSPWWQDYNYRLLAWALGAILAAGRFCCGFAISIEEPPVSGPLGDEPPVLVLARHGGLGDSFSLVWLLLDRYHRRVLIVLKDVLQWEPLIDIVLNRLGSCFIPATRSGDHLAARLESVAAGLADRDVLLVFPEGGNWTPGRWKRAIRRLRTDGKQQAAAAAAQMPHVLPPRPGGVLACLDARPDIAVVMIAHTGLDRITTARQTWDAIPFTRPMTVRWWSPPPPPLTNGARVAWLTAQWAIVDQWIDESRQPGPPTRT